MTLSQKLKTIFKETFLYFSDMFKASCLHSDTERAASEYLLIAGFIMEYTHDIST